MKSSKYINVAGFLTMVSLSLTSQLSVAQEQEQLNKKEIVAGGQEGSGGGVHYCPNSQQEVQFYDLYEGKSAQRDTSIPVFEKAWASKEVMRNFAINKLRAFNALFADRVIEQLQYFNSNKSVVAKQLRKIPDANYLWVEEGCSYEQLANWDDSTGVIYISQKFSRLMEKDPLSEVAFEMHEAIYKASRMIYMDGSQKLNNSDLVRKTVAYLFSPLDIPSELRSLFRGTYMDQSSKISTDQNTQSPSGFNVTFDPRFYTIKINLGNLTESDLKLGQIKVRYRIPLLENAASKMKMLVEKQKTATSGQEKRQITKQIEQLKENFWLKESENDGYTATTDLRIITTREQEHCNISLEMYNNTSCAINVKIADLPHMVPVAIYSKKRYTSIMLPLVLGKLKGMRNLEDTTEEKIEMIIEIEKITSAGTEKQSISQFITPGTEYTNRENFFLLQEIYDYNLIK